MVDCILPVVPLNSQDALQKKFLSYLKKDHTVLFLLLLLFLIFVIFVPILLIIFIIVKIIVKTEPQERR